MSFSKPCRISSSDVFKIYKNSYKNKFCWEDILDHDSLQWLRMYNQATNSNFNLAFGSMVSTTAALCGPKTMISNRDGSFQQSFNTYILNVSDPGGGKTTTYEHFVIPCMEMFQDKTKKPLNVDTYTHAGITTYLFFNF